MLSDSSTPESKGFWRIKKVFHKLLKISNKQVPVNESKFSEVSSCQNTETILMVAPRDFKYNLETAKNNSFQVDLGISNDVALAEFNSMVEQLRRENINILVLSSREDVETPDSIFPNNWFSVHSTDKENEKILVFYPMFTENRRLELQPDNLAKLLKKEGIHIKKTIDLSNYVNYAKFLEGTGSLILDRVNRIAYAAISPRTDEQMLSIFAKEMKYKPVTFHSYDPSSQLIYHTNVVMSVGSRYAVIALDSIPDETERVALVKQLRDTDKEIISITQEQVKRMAGNILQVKSRDGQVKIVMSETAHNAFTPEQRDALSRHGQLVPVRIKNIETVGGGSARCMMAEIF